MDTKEQLRIFSDAMKLTDEQKVERSEWVKAKSVDTFASLRLRGFLAWTDGDETADLTAALDKQGITHEQVAVPYICGMGGCATIVRYTSPKSGNPIEAICVPKRADVDSFELTTFTFAGGSLPPIAETEAMIEIYDHCETAKKAHYDQIFRLYAEYDAPQIEAARRAAGFIK